MNKMRITITDKINKRESNLLSYFLKILYISAQSYIKHKLIQNVERVLKLISFCTCMDTHPGVARVENVGVGGRGSIPNVTQFRGLESRTHAAGIICLFHSQLHW